MRRIRVGVVGTGGIFQGAHLPSYPEIPEAQIVTLCDVSSKNLQTAKRRMEELYEKRAKRADEEGNTELAQQLRKDVQQLRIYTDFKEMLRKEKPDLIEICTMPDAHAHIAISALRSRCHVMCEKPMARTWLECLEVCRVVEETGLFYQHNENWIYEPFYYTARKFIDAGLIGEVVTLYLNTSHSGPENRLGFWNDKQSGGGALLDNGIHAVTASWYIAGFDKKPVAVKAASPIGIAQRMKHRIIDNCFQDFRVEDDGHILIRYEHPQTKAWVTTHVEGSWSGSDSPQTIIFGTTGSLQPVWDEGKHLIEFTDAFGNKRRMEATGPNWTFWPSSFYGEIKHMAQCILADIKPICDHNIGAESQAIVGSAYLSQRFGQRVVFLDEFKEWALKISKKFGKRANEVLIEEQLKGVKR